MKRREFLVGMGATPLAASLMSSGLMAQAPQGARGGQGGRAAQASAAPAAPALQRAPN